MHPHLRRQIPPSPGCKRHLNLNSSI
jgi:gamma-carbonic anhydrase